MADTANAFILATWDTFQEMAPYLLFGFFIAGILSVLMKQEIVERHLGGKGVRPVIKAALFGVPLPLCSCGVIPVSASLRRHGAGAGATTSFLISTPQTGVDSILVTFSLLGPVFAVFRPLVSFFSGLVGGLAVSHLGSEDDSGKENHQVCEEECCTGSGERNGFVRALRYGFVTLPGDLNKALIVGIIIAGAISALVPDDFFASILGGGIVAMLVMMAAGIPVYVCATASVPIAAALIAKGVSPGAALVFLMTGPATNAATVTTVWKIMGKRTAGLYLATVAASAVAAGFLLDYIFEMNSLPVVSGFSWMIPGSVKALSAAALVVILAAAFIRRPKRKAESSNIEETRRLTIKVDGMSCEHCVKSIQGALMESPGVDSVEVELKKGVAFVTGTNFNVSRLKRSIEELGYKFSCSEMQTDKTYPCQHPGS